jgi:hypothetical protein
MEQTKLNTGGAMTPEHVLPIYNIQQKVEHIFVRVVKNSILMNLCNRWQGFFLPYYSIAVNIRK